MALTQFALNKAQIFGHIGSDPDIRVISDNATVMTFSVATNRRFKSGEEYKDETTWHNVVVWNPSDYVQDNLRKGGKVFIEGRIQKREYENNEGRTVYVCEIVADLIMPVGNGNGNGNSGGSSSSRSGSSSRSSSGSSGGGRSNTTHRRPSSWDSGADSEEIPF